MARPSSTKDAPARAVDGGSGGDGPDTKVADVDHAEAADGAAFVVRVAGGMAEVAADDWDRLANPDPACHNPFVSHAFLQALEEAGCVGPRTGWRPQHLLVEAPGAAIAAAMPIYLKSHSRGEYVFDYGWAEAYERAGGRYYPKLQGAVPFTPVPGPRLLVGDTADAPTLRAVLGRAAVELAGERAASSVHVTFLQDEQEAQALAEVGYLSRLDQQFHWVNAGYDSFEQFLSTFASRKRKAVRKERDQAVAAGIEIRPLTGTDITEADWDAFFAFYTDTGDRKWGTPYLNRTFFSLLGERMADRCLLLMAYRDGRPIAGALNLIGGEALYGRYWGAIEHHPCLHFEVCYHQAIEFAIARGLKRVEAGAQGEHKLARGYLPTTTRSAHFIADPGLRRAVERFLVEERRYVCEAQEVLTELGPFRRGPPPGGEERE